MKYLNRKIIYKLMQENVTTYLLLGLNKAQW